MPQSHKAQAHHADSKPKAKKAEKTESAPAASETSIEIVKQYIKACAESANRARLILIVMITTSVLTFVATWNTQESAWLTERLAVATSALHLFDEQGRRLPDGAACTAFLEAGLERKDFDNAARLIKYKRIDSRDLLVDFIERLRAIQAEQVTTVHMPFFGVVFDVNDLGKFSGFAFVVILIWARYGLSRELKNLMLTFSLARGWSNEQKILCYNLLAMQQVLTVPPVYERDESKPAERRWRKFWNLLPEIFYGLPFLVYLYMAQNDLRTLNLGQLLSDTGTKVLIVTDIVFTLFILLLTFGCFRLAHDIDREWTAAATDFGVMSERGKRKASKK